LKLIYKFCLYPYITDVLWEWLLRPCHCNATADTGPPN